jgi:hypothetical protein
MKIYLGNTTLKQTRNDNKVLFIPEDTPIGTTLAHVILNDLDSFGKRLYTEQRHFYSVGRAVARGQRLGGSKNFWNIFQKLL